MSAPILIDVPEAIQGPRVLLRPYESADAGAVEEAVMESRARLAPWMPWLEHYEVPGAARRFVIEARARWLLRTELTVGIFRRTDGRFLGSSGFHGIRWEIPTFEIGYWVRTSAEGQGYVSETVRLLTRLAFDTLQANRVEIRADPRNVRSCRVAERLGFRLEGTLRRCDVGTDGLPADRNVYALIREEYANLGWGPASACEPPSDRP